MYQSVLYGGQCVPEELLWKNMPENEFGNFQYLMDVIDWEQNIDPDFYQHRFMPPLPVRDMDEMKETGYIEEWICYKCSLVSAKRLTVLPGKTVNIKDEAAYGMIMLQGHGKFGVWDIETPA
jgi:hypothetical protein